MMPSEDFMTGGRLVPELALPCVDAAGMQAASTSTTPTSTAGSPPTPGTVASSEHSQRLIPLRAARNSVEQSSRVYATREVARQPVLEPSRSSIGSEGLLDRVDRVHGLVRRRESVLKEVSDRLQATARAINVATEGVRSASNSLGSLTRFLGDHPGTRPRHRPHRITTPEENPTVETRLPSIADSSSENTATRQVTGAYECLSQAYACLLQNTREDVTWQARTRLVESGEEVSDQLSSGQGERGGYGQFPRGQEAGDETWGYASETSGLSSTARDSNVPPVGEQGRATTYSVMDRRTIPSSLPISSPFPSVLPDLIAVDDHQGSRGVVDGINYLATPGEEGSTRRISYVTHSADGEEHSNSYGDGDGSDRQGRGGTARGVVSHESTVPIDLLRANRYPEREGRDQFEAQVVAVLRETLRRHQNVDGGSTAPRNDRMASRIRWFPSPTARVEFMERVAAVVISRLEREIGAGYEATNASDNGESRGLRWWLSEPRRRAELEADVLGIVNRRLRDYDDSWGRLGTPTELRSRDMPENSSVVLQPRLARAFDALREEQSTPGRWESVSLQERMRVVRSPTPGLSDSTRAMPRGLLSDYLQRQHGVESHPEELQQANVSSGNSGHYTGRSASATGGGEGGSAGIQEGLANIIRRASRVRHAATRAQAVLARQDVASRSSWDTHTFGGRRTARPMSDGVVGGREVASVRVEERSAGGTGGFDDERSLSGVTSEVSVSTASARARISSVVRGHLRVLRDNAQRLEDDSISRRRDRVAEGERRFTGSPTRDGGQIASEAPADIRSPTPRTQASALNQNLESSRILREVPSSLDGTLQRGREAAEAVRAGEESSDPPNDERSSHEVTGDVTSRWMVARRRMVNVALERARLQEEIARLRGRRDESLNHLQRLQQEHSRVRQRQVTALSEIVEGLGRTVDAVSSHETPFLERTHADLIAETMRIMRTAPSAANENSSPRQTGATHAERPNRSLDHPLPNTSPFEASTLVHEVVQAQGRTSHHETRAWHPRSPDVTQDVIETAIEALPQLSAVATLISDARQSLRLRRGAGDDLAGLNGLQGADQRPRCCSDETIAALPDAPPSANTGSSSGCVICLSDAMDEESMCILPCKHVFHRSCVGKWLRLQASCPTCRQEVPDSICEGS